MGLDDDLKASSDGINLVGQIIKIAGENPNVTEAANNLGKAALTITKTINVALLPLAAVNFGFDKAKAYFESRFSKDILDKAANIPPEEIVEPKPSIAGPALQGLAFSNDEESLKEMYLNLLATAMDGRRSNVVHPAFVEIIKQLSADEALILKLLLSGSSKLPIVEFRRLADSGSGFTERRRHVIGSANSSGEPVEVERLESMIDNFIRLGLIDVDYEMFLTNEGSYDWVELRPEYQRFKNHLLQIGGKPDFQKGVLTQTALGLQFGAAVGLR